MKQVLKVSDLEKTEKKPVEFTHFLNAHEVGWSKTDSKPHEFEKVVYLGFCNADGDMFSVYGDGYIRIFKGHLNDGVY